jgi:hypothetical protein
MNRALTLAASRELPLADWLRSVIVLGCAVALILAEKALPY